MNHFEYVIYYLSNYDYIFTNELDSVFIVGNVVRFDHWKGWSRMILMIILANIDNSQIQTFIFLICLLLIILLFTFFLCNIILISWFIIIYQCFLLFLILFHSLRLNLLYLIYKIRVLWKIVCLIISYSRSISTTDVVMSSSAYGW